MCVRETELFYSEKKKAEKRNRKKPVPQLPAGLQRTAHIVIPCPEPYRSPQTMTSLRRRRPDYSWGDFPGSTAGRGAEMEALSRVLKGAGAQAGRAAPPRGRRRISRAGGGQGRARADRGGSRRSSGSHWLLAGARHSGWSSPPAPGNWS